MFVSTLSPECFKVLSGSLWSVLMETVCQYISVVNGIVVSDFESFCVNGYQYLVRDAIDCQTTRGINSTVIVSK